MKKTCAIVILAIVLMQLGGCSASEEREKSIIEQEGASSNDVPSLIIPYSKGPDGPPSVKGPTAAPGEIVEMESVDAVTEDEKVEYRLPGTAEAEFKQ